jgi:hypothetical protein
MLFVLDMFHALTEFLAFPGTRIAVAAPSTAKRMPSAPPHGPPSKQQMVVNSSFITYLQDHLAGARFALELLDDLASQPVPEHIVLFRELREEIDSDRAVLVNFLSNFDETASLSREVVSWIGEKAAQLKLSLGTTFGRFEAIEILSLGVLGKLALWQTIEAVAPDCAAERELPLDYLVSRARSQHDRLEHLRISYAEFALVEQPLSPSKENEQSHAD